MNMVTLSAPARSERIWYGLLLLAGLYALAQLSWYASTALGRAPVLDGRELIHLARLWVAGELPQEPIYRAMGYPGVLAIGLALGWPESALPSWARMVNALALAITAASAWGLALRIWGGRQAAHLAAILVLLYPVSLHFAGDPLDTTVGMALFTAGVCAAAWFWDAAPGRGRWAVLATLSLALAFVFRPHYLLPLLAWLGLLGVGVARRAVDRPTWLAAVALAGAVLGGQIAWNHALSQRWVLLPWQGGYDFYAANGPEANGLYFRQTIAPRAQGVIANPTRFEAEYRYAEATGKPAADGLEVARYWRQRALDYIRAQPLDWLRLMGVKVFHLLNDHEPYNNKTYAFHQERSPWLRYNPLSWGVLLSLGLLACCLACRATPSPTEERFWHPLIPVAVLAAAYGTGVLMFYVSDRFRVPLAPLLAVAAAGVAQVRGTEWRWHGRRCALALPLLVPVWWPVPESFARITEIEDRLLIARAHSDLGENRAAESWARLALELDPNRPTAWAIVCLARFNALFVGLPASVPSEAAWTELEATCARAAPVSDVSAFVAAVTWWRRGEHERAVRRWAELTGGAQVAQRPALAALSLAGLTDAELLGSLPIAEPPDLLDHARVHGGDRRVRAALAARLGPGELELGLARLRTLFAVAAADSAP